jgi:hypothetical protein
MSESRATIATLQHTSKQLLSLGLIIAWYPHGDRYGDCWLSHGTRMAIAWHSYGDCCQSHSTRKAIASLGIRMAIAANRIALARRSHGNRVTIAWQSHGDRLAIVWRLLAIAWHSQGDRMAIS